MAVFSENLPYLRLKDLLLWLYNHKIKRYNFYIYSTKMPNPSIYMGEKAAFCAIFSEKSQENAQIYKKNPTPGCPGMGKPYKNIPARICAARNRPMAPTRGASLFIGAEDNRMVRLRKK